MDLFSAVVVRRNHGPALPRTLADAGGMAYCEAHCCRGAYAKTPHQFPVTFFSDSDSPDAMRRAPIEFTKRYPAVSAWCTYDALTASLAVNGEVDELERVQNASGWTMFTIPAELARMAFHYALHLALRLDEQLHEYYSAGLPRATVESQGHLKWLAHNAKETVNAFGHHPVDRLCDSRWITGSVHAYVDVAKGFATGAGEFPTLQTLAQVEACAHVLTCVAEHFSGMAADVDDVWVEMEYTRMAMQAEHGAGLFLDASEIASTLLDPKVDRFVAALDAPNKGSVDHPQ